MNYILVGFGVSGMLTCLELLATGVQASEIAVIDPYFDGGAFSRQWGTVRSNTTVEQITKALQKYPTAQAALQRFQKTYEPTAIVPLQELSKILLNAIQPFVSALHLYQTKCKRIQEVTPSLWRCILKSGETVEGKHLFLCQGGRPKEEDFGKPTIPLEVALDSERLKRYVQANQKIGVFGSSHSGTLVTRNCVEAGCFVFLFHKKEKPFLFARDGEYDGIKQESAEIADSILSGQGIGASVKTISLQNPIESLKAITKCSWIIQCIGFEPNQLEIELQTGEKHSSTVYDWKTGQLLPDKSLYGFGLAYPGKSVINEKVYLDISIPSFVAQLEQCLPAVFTQKQ